MLQKFKALWRNLTRKQNVEGDLDAEIRSYRQLLEDENVRAGADSQAARREAMLELGGVEQIKEEVRDIRAGVRLEAIWTELRLCSGSADIRNRAVQFAIASDRQELAYSAVRTRGDALPPVWSSAYLALTGLYLDDRSAAIDAAFQTTLDTRTIGERLKVPLKPDSVAVGSIWFYYGSRYGDYLTAGKNAAADAWLPAAIEAAPSDPDAYVRLGKDYAEAGQHAKSIDLLERALQLDPDRADAHDLIACALWAEGRRAEAVVRWKTALSALVRIQSRGVKVPEPFWSRAAQTFTDIGERHAMAEMRSDIAHQLGDYYQRNGQYRFFELIEPAVRASIASGDGIDWLVELGRATGDPGPILSELLRARGVTETQRIALQREHINLLSKRAQGMAGDEAEYGESLETGARLQLVAMLLHAGDADGATKEWNLISAVRSRWDNRLRDELEIRLAAKSRRLDALIRRYLSQPQTAPSVEDLRNGALALRRDGDEDGARSVLEFLYDREIRSGRLDSSNFIGLAEVKLQRNDAAAALGLLNRMTLVADDGLDTLLPAADLLQKYGKSSEAGRFIRRRVQAVPWDSSAKVQLARTLPVDSAERARLLLTAVNDGFAPYKLRAEAARLSAPHSAGAAQSELALLSSGNITASAARKPYQVEARLDAARTSTDMVAAFQLWQEALAIAPSDDRARAGTLRAALALRRDSLALALEQGRAQPQFGFNPGFRYYGRRSDFARYVLPQPPVGLQVSDPEHSATEEALSGAAERLGELDVAQTHLLAAIRLRPENERDALVARSNALVAELRRREQNAARRPIVKDGIDQDRAVRPRLRSIQ
jgi:tetratricopeptide (TPR) repeat protein